MVIDYMACGAIVALTLRAVRGQVAAEGQGQGPIAAPIVHLENFPTQGAQIDRTRHTGYEEI